MVEIADSTVKGRKGFALSKAQSTDRHPGAAGHGETGPMAAMPTTTGLARERRLKRLIDIGERLFSLTLFLSFALRMGMGLAARPWNAAVLLSEALVVVFILLRRPTEDISTRPQDWLFALLGTALPMMVRPGGHALILPVVGVALSFSGMLFSIWGKLILRFSFGLAAANRGVVGGGAYAFVRHPIYAGYVMVYVGFLLLNPTLWNLLVYAGVTTLLVLRILAEERILQRDPAYAEIMGRVRYRMIPGLF
jgi:protein-S-isoprenylcysteine O-methyltransferase Ste14